METAEHRTESTPAAGYIPPGPAYLEAVRNMSQEQIVMIENFPELPADYLTPKHAKIQLAHQLYWEGRPRVRPPILEHSV